MSDLDLARGEHLAEDVCERQPQVLHVVRLDQPGRGDRLRHVRPVVVRQAYALGAAGGARGVDEGGQLVLGDRGDPLLDQPGVLLQPGRPAALQLGEADHPVVRLDAVRVDDHDMAEVGQLGALRHRFGDLFGVLRDQHPAVGVRQDVGGLLEVRLGVDRRGGGARAHDAEVGEDPFHPGGGGERHPLLRVHAQLDQTGRDGVDPLGGLGPGERLPVVGALADGGRDGVAIRLGVRCGGDTLQEEGRHARRPVLDQSLCVAQDILRGPLRCGWLRCGWCTTGMRVVVRRLRSHTLV